MANRPKDKADTIRLMAILLLLVILLLIASLYLYQITKFANPKSHINSTASISHTNKPAYQNFSQAAESTRNIYVSTLDSSQSLASPTPSQRDTDVDGALMVDSNGHLIINQDTWSWFEYLLLDRSLFDEATLYHQITAALRAQLKEPALSEALDFFKQYQAYYQQLRHSTQLSKTGDFHQQLSSLKSLRNNIFGEVLSQQLFGSQMQQNDAALAMLAGDTLFQQQLPTSMKLAFKAQQQHQQLQQQINAMRLQGFDEAQIWQHRANILGMDAANRWQNLEQQRQTKTEHYQRYQQLKQSLDNDSSSDQQAVTELVKQQFVNGEQRRMLLKERLKTLSQ